VAIIIIYLILSQNDAYKGPPFLPGASWSRLAPESLARLAPAKSPQVHAERSGQFLSIYYPDLRCTGTGCFVGEPLFSNCFSSHPVHF
jgi:hypothetical protein